jgi:hypothetical protein
VPTPVKNQGQEQQAGAGESFIIYHLSFFHFGIAICTEDELLVS